jgi:hypothetical protein
MPQFGETRHSGLPARRSGTLGRVVAALVSILGFLIAALGALGMVNPPALPAFTRAWSLVAAAFGGLLVYAGAWEV